MPSKTEQLGERLSARDRLLAAADELFYEEGVHTVGIDRVIERAGVAKASLYNTFGSKDELIRAYLRGRHATRQKRITEGLAAYGTPREKILGVFEIQTKVATQPGFRGCAFLNASAESRPGGVVEEVSDENRAWMRALFTELATQAGAQDPAGLANQLVLLYDGSTVGVRMDRNTDGLVSARGIVELLLDCATRG
jgi:AcrR family transcriptional regulator